MSFIILTRQIIKRVGFDQKWIIWKDQELAWWDSFKHKLHPEAMKREAMGKTIVFGKLKDTDGGGLNEKCAP